jgi:O-antigen ligase
MSFMQMLGYPASAPVTSRLQYALVATAAALPLVFAYQAPPQPAFYGQWLCLLLWWIAGASLLVAPAPGKGNARSQRGWRVSALGALIVVVAVFALLVLAHVAFGLTPAFVAFPTLAALTTMLLCCVAIARCDARSLDAAFSAVCVGLALAALLNVLICILQIFAPSLYHPFWIAEAGGDRPYGNLRQPNLFALLLIWGAICAACLFNVPGRARIALGAIFAVFAFALWASNSRSGWLAAALCATVFLGYVWRRRASDDRSKIFRTRFLVCAAIFLAACALTLLAVTLQDGAHTSNSEDMRALSVAQRITLWNNVVALISSQPWLGVGYGQLSFAWMLTPLNPRASDLFDHAHNAPLHLAVELGIPIAAALMVALVLIVGYASLRSRAPWRIAALMMLLAAATQSLFEYPLWFAFFAIPSVVVLTLLCASASRATAEAGAQKINARVQSTPEAIGRGPLAVALPLVLCAGGLLIALWTLNGYRAVSDIYASARDPQVALARAETASKHAIYGHYGDYAQIMLLGDTAPLTLFSRPIRAALDDRLLTAWARAYERANDTARAQYLVDRAREFVPFPSQTNLPLLPALPTLPASAAGRLRATDFK